MPTQLIKLENLSKSYPMGEVTVHALRHLNLDIAQGEFVVLLGPSGCGKTTALNMIGGLDRPTSGHIIIAGEDIAQYSNARLTDYRLRQVGFVFQFFNLIPTLTACENVEFALALDPRMTHSRDRAREMLARVAMQERSDHFPSQLSGGEQQRVAVARALSNQPAVLLCDEPTGNLDAETGQQVLRVIRDSNRQVGATVVLVTHNTAIAPIANRIVRLRDGQIDRVETNDKPRDAAELTW